MFSPLLFLLIFFSLSFCPWGVSYNVKKLKGSTYVRRYSHLPSSHIPARYKQGWVLLWGLRSGVPYIGAWSPHTHPSFYSDPSRKYTLKGCSLYWGWRGCSEGLYHPHVAVCPTLLKAPLHRAKIPWTVRQSNHDFLWVGELCCNFRSSTLQKTPEKWEPPPPSGYLGLTTPRKFCIVYKQPLYSIPNRQMQDLEIMDGIQIHNITLDRIWDKQGWEEVVRFDRNSLESFTPHTDPSLSLLPSLLLPYKIHITI